MRTRSSGFTCLESLSPSIGAPPLKRPRRRQAGRQAGRDPPRLIRRRPTHRALRRSRPRTHTATANARAPAASASRRRRATSTALRTPLRVSATSERSKTLNASSSARCSWLLISATVKSSTPFPFFHRLSNVLSTDNCNPSRQCGFRRPRASRLAARRSRKGTTP